MQPDYVQGRLGHLTSNKQDTCPQQRQGRVASVLAEFTNKVFLLGTKFEDAPCSLDCVHTMLQYPGVNVLIAMPAPNFVQPNCRWACQHFTWQEKSVAAIPALSKLPKGSCWSWHAWGPALPTAVALNQACANGICGARCASFCSSHACKVDQVCAFDQSKTKALSSVDKIVSLLHNRHASKMSRVWRASNLLVKAGLRLQT